jgi:hypothetical protein
MRSVTSAMRARSSTRFSITPLLNPMMLFSSGSSGRSFNERVVDDLALLRNT